MEAGLRGRRDLDVLADETLEDLLHARDVLGEVDDLRRDDLLSREGEQLARQLGGAPTGLVDLRDVPRSAVVGGERLGEPVGSAEDHGEQVVEVVSHAPREPADALHSLRVQELLFESLSLRDVEGDARDADDPIAPVSQRRVCGLERDAPDVARQVDHFASERALEGLGEAGHILVECMRGEADHLPGLEPERLERLTFGEREDTFAIHREQQDGRSVDDGAQAVLALAERLGGALSRGRVAHERREDPLAAGVEGGDRDLRLELRAVLSPTAHSATVGHGSAALAALRELSDVLCVCGRDVRRKQHRQRLSDHLRGAIAEDALRSLVERRHTLGRVDGDDAVLGDLEDPAEPSLDSSGAPPPPRCDR